MAISAKSLGIDQLGIEERLTLIDEIWATICADAASFPLSEAQRSELERRISENDSNPDDVVTWNEVKAAAREQFRR
jgi:putative addiction module component (TIGR02574 family)